jgi:hypothetical protein
MNGNTSFIFLFIKKFLFFQNNLRIGDEISSIIFLVGEQENKKALLLGGKKLQWKWGPCYKILEIWNRNEYVDVFFLSIQ